MPPLHIVIDVRRIRGFGVGTYIRNITRALARVDHENRYMLVAAPADVDQLEGLGPNFRGAAYPQPDFGLKHHLQIPGFLASLRANLYHIPLNTVAWRMPRPYVLTIHDLSTLLFAGHKDVRQALHEARFRRAALRAAHVISVSNTIGRDIEDVLGVPAARISTVYNAPDPAFTTGGGDGAQDREIMDRYSIHHPFILYAGTIRTRKNIPRLVEAFAVLLHEVERHPRFKDIRLVIIGDDLSRNPAVRRAVAQARIESSVRFLGFVPIETLRVFYRAAELFAFPSLYEGFGLAPLEAMACGTPVVASNIPSLVEAVGDAAELVSPDNVFDIARGLRAVLLDPDRRRALAAAGLAQAERFHWDTTARQVLAIYRNVSQKKN